MKGCKLPDLRNMQTNVVFEYCKLLIAPTVCSC